MSPRSRSRSISARRSYSKSPGGRRNVRRKSRSRHSKEHPYSSRSRSLSRQPPSPPPLPPARNGRYSGGSKSSSRSLSPSRHRRRLTRTRSRSRSPYDKRRGTREKPMQSRCIGVFGLSVYTTQQRIREIFSKFGPIERIQVVIDAQTGRSRGFCFIYYEDMSDAKAAKDACSGMEIDDRRIRVDYSITKRPHTPTPGVYMGRPTRAYRERGEYHDRYREEYRPRRRSPSPYARNNFRTNDRRRRYVDRSRSRSYSPRRSRY